jgi:hypothetical protein
MGQILCIAISIIVRHIVHFSTSLYLKQHKLYLEGFIYIYIYIYCILYIEMLLEHQLNEMNCK